MKIWLTTDTHFNHDKMVEFCGRPQGFEDLIFKHLREVIKPGDLLIHLGDVCIGKDAEMHEKYIQSLDCKKWLIIGNHDHKSYSWYLSHGWDFVSEKVVGTFFGKKLSFTHEPTLAFEEDFNIHGHLHNTGHHPEFELTNRHKLLAIENTDYKPVLLETFIK